MSRTAARAGFLGAALALAVLSAGAQTTPAARARSLVDAVRADLAHGAPDAARARLSGAGSAREKAVANALIAAYAGDDDAAKRLLDPIVGPNDRDDAALELGLLEYRHGRRETAVPLLERLTNPGPNMSAHDYWILARAADAVGEYHLAGDAYQQVGPQGSGGAEVQSDWADLFLETDKVAEAVKGYQFALQADPAWVPAYVGLARALADDEPDHAAEAFAKAQQLAPHDPRVLKLAAERALAQDRFAQANAALDQLAAAKPKTVDEFGLRAVLAYAQHDDANVEPLIAQALAVNPHAADPYCLVAARAAQMYRDEDAAAFAAKAVALDDDSARAHGDHGLYLLRVGDEPAARKELERAWDLDQHTNVVVFNMLTLLDDLDGFTVVPHNQFIFKFSAKDAPVLSPYALPLADDAYARYVQRYGFTPQGPILIEVFPKHDDFAVRTVGLQGITGALGACFGRVVTMDSPSARPPGDFSWQATLAHELAHVFTLQLSDYRVPRWLTEGMSVYEEYRRNPAWGRELTLEFAEALGEGQTFGFKKLPDGFKNGDRLALAYFEASLVVEHLVDVGGEAALHKTLVAYAHGASDADALQQATGMTPDQFEASYRSFIDTRYGALRDAMKAPAKTVDQEDLPGLQARAHDAPGNFISQLSYGHALFEDKRFDDAEAPLARAAALAPEASGAGSPHALLAEIAEEKGDHAKAIAELEALLRFDHTNVAAARELAKIAAAQHDDADFDRALRLIVDLDPYDLAAHQELGRRALQQHDAPRAVTEFTVALGLKPVNEAEAETDVAEALLADGKPDDAKKHVLAALADAPTYARAQDLLLKILGK